MSKASAWGLATLAAGLLMSACGGGSSSYGSSPTSMPTAAPNPTATADVVITITGMAGDKSFSPSPANVKAGQTVAWKNASGTAHTATQDGSGGFDTGSIAAGATSAPIAISAAGSLTYHCSFHPSMVGSVDVASTSAGY